MPKLKMTTAAIDRTTAAAGERVDYFDDHRDRVRGLVLRVSGRLDRNQKLVISRSWSVVYRVKGVGRLRRVTIGPYPAYSLADARTEAEEAVKIARRGDDPAEQRKATAANAKAEAERDAVETVEAVVDEFVRRHLEAKKRAPRYIEETRRNFDLHVLPKWRGRTVASITRRDVATLLNGIADQGKPIAANRTLAAVRAMFNWALRRGLVDANPAGLLDRPGAETRRERTLTGDELRVLWPQFAKLGFPFGDFFALALITGQRRDEVAGIRWSEIKAVAMPSPDPAVTPISWTWTLEADRTKGRRAHVVPLPTLATDLLAKLPRLGAYVLTTTGDKPISGYSKAKADLDEAVASVRKVAKAKDLPGWTIHDLRRTCATELARLEIPRLTIGKLLNHADQGVTAIYDRHEYLAEKRRALEVWGQYLHDLVNPSPADTNVVSLTSRAS
jgi:integrase